MMHKKQFMPQCGKRFLLFGKMAFSFFFGALAQLSHPLLRSSAHLFRLWQKAVLSHNNEQ